MILDGLADPSSSLYRSVPATQPGPDSRPAPSLERLFRGRTRTPWRHLVSQIAPRTNRPHLRQDPSAARRRSHFVAFFLLIGLTFATVASAYTVVLKDGSTMTATQKYEVRGEWAYIDLISGTTTRIPVSEINVEKTNQMNSANYGSAKVIDGREERPLSFGEAPPQTLEDVLRRRQQGQQRQASRSNRDNVAMTAAGYPDLVSLRRVPVEDESLLRAVRAALADQGIQAEIYRGTRDSTVFLDMVADHEDAVFEALDGSAKAFETVKESHGSLSAFQLLMRTTSRSRSGQFELSSENVSLLTQKRMSLPDFFLQYVQF